MLETDPRLDAILDEFVASCAVMAAESARQARLLAEATGLQLAGVPSSQQGDVMRSLVAEIACAAHLSESTVLRRLNDAEILVRSLPGTLAALESGSISYRHAQILAGHALSLPESARRPFEDALLTPEPPRPGAVPPPAAATLTAARFDRHARLERERRHPESIDTRAATAAAERHVRIDPAPDGMAWLTCHLPAVAAAAIDDRLDRIARAARTAHPASATPTVHPAPAAQPSDPTSPSHTPPTHGQLRADALTSLLLAFPGTPRSARRASAAAIPTAAPGTCVPPPVISTAAPGTPTDDSPVDHALPGLAPLDLAALGVEHIVPTVILTVPVLSLLGHDDAPADLHGHGPIDLPTARRLAAKAPSFVRILTHPVSGETLTVERTRYRPTADQRLALQLDDVTCRFPGCGRRAPRCELDHTTDWAHGGATSRANLHHLCSKHHHLKHDRTGWTVTAHPGRLLEWTSPTGRTHTTVPAGRAHTTVPAGPTRAPSAPSPPTGSSLGFRPTPHGSRTRPRFREQPADADPG